MSSKETMLIAFPTGGILPASIAGGKEVPVDAHAPVRVPTDYGKHLIHDRFAYEVLPKGKARNAGTDDVAKARERLEADLADLRKKADEATDPKEKTRLTEEIAAAEQKLADIPAAS